MKIYHIQFHDDWDCYNYVLIAETEADAMLNLYNWFDTVYSYDDNIGWWNNLVDEYFRCAEVVVKDISDVVDIHQSFD